MAMEEPQIAAVTFLSDSSSEAVKPEPKKGKGRKRKRVVSKKQPPIDDVARVQNMLAKKTKCKANCKDEFRSKGGQRELLQFRSEWRQLHKTDQDEVVLGQCAASFFFNPNIYIYFFFIYLSSCFFLFDVSSWLREGLLFLRLSSGSMIYGIPQRDRQGAAPDGNSWGGQCVSDVSKRFMV